MERMSGLPMIKCSSCGIDIDILQLADHVCATAPPPAAPSAPPPASAAHVQPHPEAPVPETLSPKLERATTFGGPSFSARYEKQAYSSGRMPAPPRIDSQAANKPFRPLEPSPMSSNYSDPRSHSPLPSAPLRSPYPLNRSATSPVPPFVSPPSPDMYANMDSAFPRFPTKATPRSPRPQEHDRLNTTYNQRYAEPSPLFAPLSPRTNGGESVSKRMDSIAPGPFDSRRPSTASAPRSPSQEQPLGHRRTETQGSIRSIGGGSISRTSLASSTSRASAHSNRSAGLPSRGKPEPVAAMPAPPLAAATVEDEGIDAFLGRLQNEAKRPGQLSQDDRSKTYPLRKESQERKGPPPRPRRPSEKDLPPANIAEYKTSDFAPRSNNMFPSRNPSRTESESGLRQGPVPTRSLQPSPPPVIPNYTTDTPIVPLHTPSDSGLSDDSYASYTTRSVASSRSSPPSSEVGHSRSVSKVSRSDYLAEESLQRTVSPDSYAEAKPLPSQTQGRRAPTSYTRPNLPEPIPQILSPGFPSPRAPESPLDPAIQLGESFERRPKEPPVLQDPALNLAQGPPRRRPGSGPRQAEVRRPAPANKGSCRGCSELIVGKSVKDSSGRLTGRYHRSCFVCQVCGDGFPTAEFYVFENAPYCEHHYHKLNGSLCNSCNRGIEGQYLETDARQKFHPRCFTCSTCRVPLSADYYEVGGQMLCERHGQRAAAPRQNYLGPGDYRPRNVQKRRTRLMMM
ncbi:zinc ion binding [Ascochyta rabiei]|uniref:Zinc ion binding n=1 Tax=Didymella rabiei TaxID=5454 RepID=A0A163JS46_DIDRA|nr:zinc ion binding [Ascochyta rabiei]